MLNVGKFVTFAPHRGQLVTAISSGGEVGTSGDSEFFATASADSIPLAYARGVDELLYTMFNDGEFFCIALDGGY